MKSKKGKVAITIFSSNIGRIVSIAKAAKACGRDVGVIGRSLHRMAGAGKLLGYLDDIDLVSESDLGFLPDDRVAMIMTGSQGEYRSALAKTSRGEHPSVSLKRGDCVIFSSRSIPGNEKEIGAVKNNLAAGGIEIVTVNDTEEIIHVSGHPCQEEIAEMYSWVKPACVIPVHGERTQLEAQAKFAAQCQIGQTIIPNNGSVIKLAPGKPEVVDHIETGLLAVDQRRIIPSDHASILERRKLQYTGAIHATVVLDEKGELLAKPAVSTLGLIDEGDEAEQNFMERIHQEVVDLLDDMSWEERMDDHFVSEELRIGLRRFSVHILGIKPITTIHLARV
ncbi:MAG: ribonuclease J [Alphaproteobacteria bacterium]|nr:ribonuclease J [Alphaproteobacteria bacterium]